MLTTVAQKITTILGSKKFFYVIVAVLVISAGWIAFSSIYPMAFDESFHLGIIQIYAHQWSPFLALTPPNSGQFGELTHDPSYIYHYLMSFPYRLVNLFIHDSINQIIIMRLLNIGLFVGGLVGFRRLLMRIGASSAITNFSLLMLVLLPVTPLLASQINYDNMLFLLLPINLIFVLNTAQSIAKRKQVEARDLILMIAIGCLTSLVKYVYLPIFAASILHVLVVWLKYKQRKKILHSVLQSFRVLHLAAKIGLTIILVLSSGLFAQRYVVNAVLYHDIQPECNKVETLEHCLQYGPWARNYNLKETAQSAPSRPVPLSFPEFILSWTNTMIDRLYFTIDYAFVEYAPMPLPITMAYIIGGIGLILVLTYCLSLLYVNYTEYLTFDKMVAINGRYFVPLLPFVFIIIGLAYRCLFAKLWPHKTNIIKSSLTIVAIFVALQGGGALTYLIHSEPAWYWQNSPLTGFNIQTQKIITPLIIGAKK